MARIFEGQTDFLMTLDGDLAVGPDGDIALIRGFEWLAGEINKIIRTINPEWVFHPTLGANLEEFVGSVNDRMTGRQITQRIKEAIVRSNLSGAELIDVRVTPVDLWSILIVVTLVSEQTRTVLSKVVFDFKDGVSQKISEGIAPEPEIRGSVQVDPHHRKARFNKYLSRNKRR